MYVFLKNSRQWHHTMKDEWKRGMEGHNYIDTVYTMWDRLVQKLIGVLFQRWRFLTVEKVEKFRFVR